MTVCVFASSSSRIGNSYLSVAFRLGELFAAEKIDVVYGGGRVGLMGKMADAIIENGGSITGVIPSFMKNEGWDHDNVKNMIVTTDMGERKRKMFSMADAIVALPGGLGTLEELTEAMTLKQLGIFNGKIVILNSENFYKLFIDFLSHMVSNHFLSYEHSKLWESASTPEEVIKLLLQ